jgi:hypothetical protein
MPPLHERPHRIYWSTFAVMFVLTACAARPRVELGAECELTAECAAPLVCRLERCRAECRSNRDCRDGLACFRENGFGVCELEYETCVLSSDCPESLVCLAGRCANACETTVDCPSGMECVAGPSGGRGCRDDSAECQFHTQCEEWEFCAPDHRCREQCRTDRDCRDGAVCRGEELMRVCIFPTPQDGGLLDSSLVDSATN